MHDLTTLFQLKRMRQEEWWEDNDYEVEEWWEDNDYEVGDHDQF
jgi:hypothetical protein